MLKLTSVLNLPYTLVDNFWLNFDDKAVGIGLYVGHAAQPYFNSQSEHGIDH